VISFRFEGFGFYEINEMHEVKGEKKESHAHSITSRRVRELRLRDVRGRNEKPRMALSVEQCRKSAQVHAGNSIVCISSMHIQYTLFRVIYREVAC
jgi:hypothetical protein